MLYVYMYSEVPWLHSSGSCAADVDVQAEGTIDLSPPETTLLGGNQADGGRPVEPCYLMLQSACALRCARSWP